MVSPLIVTITVGTQLQFASEWLPDSQAIAHEIRWTEHGNCQVYDNI